MKIQTITYSRGATINQGNFNSSRFDVSVTVELDAEDNAAAVYDKAKSWVSERIRAEVQNINKEPSA